MLGFMRYGGSELDEREEEDAVDGTEVGVEENMEDEGLCRCPFPVGGCLRMSEPEEPWNMLWRSPMFCPGLWRKEDPPLPPMSSG